MRQTSGSSVATAHVWSRQETVCHESLTIRRRISRDHRVNIGDVFGKMQRYYASKSMRDRIASFRIFIAVMMQLTIDLGREFQR
jgi:hypothetical protein